MPRRIIATTLLLTFTMASCRTWTPLEGIPDPMPEEVRVQLLSGERVEVMDARMEADTLVGRLPGGDQSIRIPTNQIALMEVGSVAEGRTVLAVVGVGVVIFLGALAHGIGELYGITPQRR